MFTIIKRAIAPLAITLATASTPVFAAGSPLGVWIDHTGRGAVEITDCNGKQIPADGGDLHHYPTEVTNGHVIVDLSVDATTTTTAN